MQLLQESKRRQFSRGQRRLVVLTWLVVLAGGVFFYHPVKLRYDRWRASRAVERSSAFAHAGDMASALVSLDVAARLASFDPAQLRIVAEVLALAGSPQAVVEYRRLTELEPSDTALRETALRVALRFRAVEDADAMLAALTPELRADARFARLDARLAALAGRSDDRQRALRAVLGTNPDDPVAQLELATEQLSHIAEAESARDTLRHLAARAGPERLAARELLARDAVQQHRPDEAVRWARALAEDSEATFSHRLFLLNLEHEVGAPGAGPLLARLQVQARSSPDNVAALATWLLLQQRVDETEDWLRVLDPAVRSSPLIRRVEADLAVLAHRWPTVAARLREGAWGPVNEAAVDLAVAAKLLRERGRAAIATDVWAEAVAAAGHDVRSLIALYRLSLVGEEQADVDTALRALSRADPRQPWAARSLALRAHARHDTAAFRDAYALWHEIEPSNQRVTAEWAFATLLLDPHSSPQLEARTRELYAQNPTDPQYAVVRAFCLWRAQRYDEAKRVLSALPPAELKQPGRALVYAAVLASLHAGNAAEPYIALAGRAPLLPEEAAILREATRSAGTSR